MKIRLLNGNAVDVNLWGNRRKTETGSSRSKFQFRVGEWLSKHYPGSVILEEVYIPIEGFYLDFFIPSLKLVVEVQGVQHDEFVPFFHGDKRTFHQQQSRDKRKRELCELNNFTFLEIRSDDDIRD